MEQKLSLEKPEQLTIWNGGSSIQNKEHTR
jgi:hypothetical protein